MPEAGVCAIVLAAGLGRRYRQAADADKLLAPCIDSPAAPAVLQATLAALDGVAARRLVAVPEANRALRERLAGWIDPAQILALTSRGLGHSLAQAVAACPAERGWLVVLGDMPYVRHETLVRLAAAIQPGSLVVPVHDGQAGHPRGIGVQFREQLLALDGDAGAQALFREQPVTRLVVDDPGVLQDIDQPGDRRAAP